MEAITVRIADALAERGWIAVQDALPEAIVTGLREEADALYDADRFRDARIGSGGSQVLRSDIRNDRILWLDRRDAPPARRAYHDFMEDVRSTLNRTLFLGLVDFECHYAVYEEGAYYETHVDRFRDSDARMISTVLYLNEDWTEGDGGQIRLHLPEGLFDIFPSAGTLAVFRSDDVPHEVLPARRRRRSLTGWFRRRSFTDIFP